MVDLIATCSSSTMLESAFAGLVAALAATVILGCAKFLQRWMASRRDVKYIRELLTKERTSVLESKVLENEETFIEGMNVTVTANEFRAALYNKMVKHLEIALEKWTIHLSNDKRNNILDALDWYNTKTDGLQVLKRNGKAFFVIIPDGRWPVDKMLEEEAREKFEKLQSIKWLKL